MSSISGSKLCYLDNRRSSHSSRGPRVKDKNRQSDADLASFFLHSFVDCNNVSLQFASRNRFQSPEINKCCVLCSHGEFTDTAKVKRLAATFFSIPLEESARLLIARLSPLIKTEKRNWHSVEMCRGEGLHALCRASMTMCRPWKLYQTGGKVKPSAAFLSISWRASTGVAAFSQDEATRRKHNKSSGSFRWFCQPPNQGLTPCSGVSLWGMTSCLCSWFYRDFS